MKKLSAVSIQPKAGIETDGQNRMGEE